MNTQVEHLDNHTARLTVEVDSERVEKAMQAAAKKISQQVQIPGFRKGKAPYKIILQRFGVQNVLSEAIELLGNDIYKEALEEAKIEPYAPGSLDNIETEPGVKMIFSVPKRPEIELGNYREVRVAYEPVEVTDEQVNKAIKSLQERRALIEPSSRPAQLGDQVKVKANATVVHPEHEQEEGHEGHDHSEQWLKDEELEAVLTTDEKEESVIPGFSQQIVGLSTGESKDFTLSFPDDYEDKAVAGHTYNFSVTVDEVQTRTLPVLNDDFAKTTTNGEIDTLLGLRMDVRKQLQDMATRDADSAYADKVLDQMLEGATIKYPEEMVDDYIHDILNDLDRNLRQRGLSLEDYKRLQNRTDEQLHEEYRDSAIRRLKRSLVLGEVVNQEQLVISAAELDAQIDTMSKQFGEQAEIFKSMLMKDQNRQNVASDMMTNRAMKRLVAIGRGDNPLLGPDPVEETAEAAPSATTTEAAAEIATEAPAEASVEITTEVSEEVSNTAPNAE